MSQLRDLLELIRTTNEVYFITAPERVRAVFILVDDIIELSLKTYLYQYTIVLRARCKSDFIANRTVVSEENQAALDSYFNSRFDINELARRLGRNGQAAINSLQTSLNAYGDLRHWSVNNPENRKDFNDVVNEVKALQPAGCRANELLDNALQRHSIRNKLYHDHHSAGWSIQDERCLQAMCELFDLLAELFPDFLTEVKHKTTVGCQIGVLRLKLAAHQGRNEVVQPYINALNALKKDHKYDTETRSVEHSIVHTVSDSFFSTLREQFANSIAELQTRIHRINQMARPTTEHRIELAHKQRLVTILENQLAQINDLLSIP